MIELRKCPSLPYAFSAAAYLRSNGVLARGYQRLEGFAKLGELAGIRTTEHAFVSIAFELDRDVGEALLAEFEALPAPDESQWEDEADPDLTKLAIDLPVPCEWCKHDLRRWIKPRTRPGDTLMCPNCAKPNDPVERVVAKHGPEALLACYPEPTNPDWIDDETLLILRIPCQKCGYALDGLPERGQCPECATQYEKRSIVERSFMDIPM